MSKYLLLILLNAPIILAGLVRSVVTLKLRHTTRDKAYIRILVWLLALVVIVFAQPLYDYLIANNLTDSSPLSIFDVAQITAILLTFFVAMRAYNKAEIMDQKYRQLHQELSIRLSDKD